MVLTLVVLLYMLYPTTLLQVFSMLACKQVGDVRYLVADLQEPCFEGRHLTWVLALCIPQLILYVLSLPVLSVYFLHRNKSRLWSSRVVMFRYGLLFNGYGKEHYYWEATMAARKASIVALGVFGSLAGVENQTHVGLAILVLFLVIHLAASPYDKTIDPKGILHALDSTSLLIIWATLWSGLLFLRDSLPGRISKELLTVTVVAVNIVYTLRGIYLLIRELLREKGVIEKIEVALQRRRSRSKSLEQTRANQVNGEVKVDVDPKATLDRRIARNYRKKQRAKERHERASRKKLPGMHTEGRSSRQGGTHSRFIEMTSMEKNIARESATASIDETIDSIVKDGKMRGSSRKLVSNEFVNPLLSSQRRLKVNPMYGNTKSRKRGVTRAATVISKTNKKNAKNKDQAETEIASTAKNEEEEAHGVEKVDGNYQPTQYYYDYDEDGDIFYYRRDGTGDSVWDLPEGAVWVEKEEDDS